MTLRTRSLRCAAFAAALFASCAQFPIEGAAPAQAEPRPLQETSPWGGSKLYARDGSVVGDAPMTGQETRTAAPREIESADGGRMYILELYQKAIDERDALQGELGALRSELRTVQEALIASERDLDDADVQVESLRKENQRLLDENVDLAARLATAQIRRLQVEKILLEMRIDELKALQAAAANVASAESESAEKKP